MYFHNSKQYLFKSELARGLDSLCESLHLLHIMVDVPQAASTHRHWTLLLPWTLMLLTCCTLLNIQLLSTHTYIRKYLGMFLACLSHIAFDGQEVILLKKQKYSVSLPLLPFKSFRVLSLFQLPSWSKISIWSHIKLALNADNFNGFLELCHSQLYAMLSAPVPVHHFHVATVCHSLFQLICLTVTTVHRKTMWVILDLCQSFLTLKIHQGLRLAKRIYCLHISPKWHPEA